MRCIFAVLYLRELDSMMSNRLVVMSADDYPSYGVYIPPGDKFLVPTASSGITITENKPSHDGTYNALYCSNTLRTRQIVMAITVRLTPLPPYVLCPPDPSHTQAISCNDHITYMMNRPFPVKLFSLSEVLEGNKCTLSQVITLGQKGLILPSGYYAYDTPSNQEPMFYLATDRRVKVSEILMSKLVFKAMHQSRWHILAWSQGHLHLFREEANPKYWTKITKYGEEKENAVTIIEFLISYNLINHYFQVTPQGEDIKLTGNGLKSIPLAYSYFKNRNGVKYNSRMMKKISPDRFISNRISQTSEIELNEPLSDESLFTMLRISNLVTEEAYNQLRVNYS
ncbi:BgTH12-00480 [Blumeria graminis f. sp. triticale]|uniref:BgTH12-00480 n=1 Tax=Blumeria graminis f. sp. triticale TaxID=1689686 RepID=A0A9W4GHE1_BLUGR|nr:BgTH12-00480 [Blumeria graminis f. sp. triticale]